MTKQVHRYQMQKKKKKKNRVGGEEGRIKEKKGVVQDVVWHMYVFTLSTLVVVCRCSLLLMINSSRPPSPPLLLSLPYRRPQLAYRRHEATKGD